MLLYLILNPENSTCAHSYVKYKSTMTITVLINSAIIFFLVVGWVHTMQDVIFVWAHGSDSIMFWPCFFSQTGHIMTGSCHKNIKSVSSTHYSWFFLILSCRVPEHKPCPGMAGERGLNSTNAVTPGVLRWKTHDFCPLCIRDIEMHSIQARAPPGTPPPVFIF